MHVCIVFAYVHEQFYPHAFILQDSFYFLFEFFSNISDTSSLYCEYQTLAWDIGLHSNLSPDPPSPPATVAPPAPNPPTSTQAGQVFIRSFVFQPALPIKIDYTTKWRFPTDTMVSYGQLLALPQLSSVLFPKGTLPGILISLYHLDNSELTLKSLNCKTGYSQL